MEKAIEHLKTELSGVRPGRASPGMLDHLTVVAYGDKMPIRAVGTVSVKDPQMLGVSVFDPETAEAVAKAIRDCPLALNPSVEGSEVLVPIPRPTQEGLAGMAKMVAKEAEKCKVGLRRSVGVDCREGKSHNGPWVRWDACVFCLTVIESCISLMLQRGYTSIS